MACFHDSEPAIVDNDFVGNSTDPDGRGGAILYFASGGPAFWFEAPGPVDIRDNTFIENEGGAWEGSLGSCRSPR